MSKNRRQATRGLPQDWQDIGAIGSCSYWTIVLKLRLVIRRMLCIFKFNLLIKFLSIAWRGTDRQQAFYFVLNFHMKYFAFLILAFVLSCNSNPQKQILAKDSTRMIIVDQGDKEMDAAIARAKLTLPNFDSALLSRNSNYTGFAIKVRFAYGENNGEHIWLKFDSGANYKFEK